MMRSIATRNDAHSGGRPEGRCSFLKKRTKRLLRVLSRFYQAAPGSKFAKVFCFFSSEKKALLPPPLPAAGRSAISTDALRLKRPPRRGKM